jgi:hypothetical protein
MYPGAKFVNWTPPATMRLAREMHILVARGGFGEGHTNCYLLSHYTFRNAGVLQGCFVLSNTSHSHVYWLV